MRKIFIALMVLMALALGGCCSPRFNPLHTPAKNMTNTILPEYREYVLNDDKLSAQEKSFRLNNAKAFEILVREYERK